MSLEKPVLVKSETERTTEKKKTHALLGFNKKETDAMVDSLNELLANYSMHYQKLLNFHWNVKGGDFFDIHEKFEQEYDSAK